ncbi:N-acetyltransferase [Brachybacterium sp. YJGR34]|uniref:GNAT family N-acetyltransferase n=1 Tax=Brachybacterium sp. YJGR34 TaxID=2059911 RepID=UPI001E457542|nr:GNAT family N-acetyltransferase [Brachybacterium sp. YJGR34]
MIAVEGTAVCGAAWFRLFTRETARAGYVDDSTPELVLAVNEGFRRAGIGSRLLDELLRRADELQVPRLSLHVDATNAPAAELYRSRGFEEVRAASKGVVMAWARPGETILPGTENRPLWAWGHEAP